MGGNNTLLKSVLRNLLILILVTQISSVLIRMSSFDLMKCSYGERGSLTATCVNATPSYFKNTPYRFDHLDETVRCVNCSLATLESGTFDISGNQIKNLDLSYSLINTIRQRAFVGLIFLEKLILANNDIKSIYPGTFAGVKKISLIDLANNSISILSEDGFLELNNLKKLILRDNKINKIATKAFNGLVNLNILDLSNNQINDIKDVFDDLMNLEVLDLTHNQISTLSGNDFKNLTRLLEIRFPYNYIKNIPSMEFGHLISLRRLDLSSNLIGKIMAGSFSGLISLENLTLHNNNIPEVPQRTFQSLHNLHNLDISNNKLSIFLTGQYSGLPQLRTLNLSNNAIEDIEVTGVFSLDSLHVLDVSKNNITDIDYIGLISRLPRISLLNLEDNLLPCGLEKEMESYFAQDNFKFLLYRNEVGSVKCVDNPRIAKVKEKYHKDSLVREEERAHPSSAATIWIFTLICIILVLVGFLYYTQFHIYRQIKASNNSFQRSTSEVQLISSELESRERDNDFLKE